MLVVTLATGAGQVKVEHEQLGLLGAVARANGAHELGGRGPNTPHDAARPAGAQLHKVTDKFARLHVPKLHCAVVRRGHHESVARLEASHGRLVLVWTCGQTDPLILGFF